MTLLKVRSFGQDIHNTPPSFTVTDQSLRSAVVVVGFMDDVRTYLENLYQDHIVVFGGFEVDFIGRFRMAHIISKKTLQ